MGNGCPLRRLKILEFATFPVTIISSDQSASLQNCQRKCNIVSGTSVAEFPGGQRRGHRSRAIVGYCHRGFGPRRLSPRRTRGFLHSDVHG